MNFIVRFFHEIRNPHCEHCTEELMSDPVIEELKTELAAIRYERDRLLKYILEEPKSTSTNGVLPSDDGNTKEDELKPIQPKVVPWHVRRQMLEEEDRQKARQLEEFKKEQADAINKLEKELKLDIPEDPNVQSQSVKVNERTSY